MSKSNHIREVYDKLLEKALEDGKISQEEQSILDKVEFELNAYESLLRKAMEDRIIDENESKELRKSRAKLLDEAWMVADKDQQISEEEATLLNLLLKLLRNI